MSIPAVGGLHGLEVVSDVENADIDIIAVHGLGAESAYAWRHVVKVDGKPTGKIINWLQDEDFLPKEIPNARVLAFNYYSKWLASGTKISVWGLGEELMREIWIEREANEKARGRPIIFVGHSFGGIIIEQGIISAAPEFHQCHTIPQCTVGIALIGTPHRGSESANWGALIANISESCGFGGEGGLMKELQEGSKNLEKITNAFMMWVLKYFDQRQLGQFFETQKTNYSGKLPGVRWNTLVVPEESACLPGYPRIPLPTDHLKMAKYDSPNNAAWGKVKNVLKMMAKLASEAAVLRIKPRQYIQDNSQIAAVNLECQKALFVSWPESELKGIKRRLGDRTPETCEWLLSKEAYGAWIMGNKPQILRLVGDPGMGKSMIITFLIEQLTVKLQSTPDMVLAYHFCDNRNQSSNNSCAVVRQMLFQLFQQRPSHFHILQKAYDVQGNKLFGEFDSLWSIFLQVVKNYGEGEIYILIDALDECDELSRSVLLNGLKEISVGTLNVRIFFTCRPEDDIERHHKGRGIRTVDVNVGKEDIDKDLRRYMDDKVPDICGRHDWGEKEKILISETLVRKAEGIFLWCAFVLEDINKLTHKGQLQYALDTLPLNLVEVYQRITHAFSELDEKSARMVLEVVAGARRPLTLRELTMTYVLAIDSPVERDWEENTIPSDDECIDHDQVYKCCGRILRKDEPTNTINLVHQSAKDYLLSEWLAGTNRGQRATKEKPNLTQDERKANTKATSIRLNNLYLELIFRYYGLSTFEHLQYRMVFDAEWDIDWECSWWEMEPSPAFMTYAGREWELHCKDAEGHGAMGEVEGMDRFDEHIRPSTKNSWLRRAAIEGNQPFVEWLLRGDHAAEMDSADFRGWTSLQLAAKHGKENIVKYLVQTKEADINATPPHIDGRTPIQTAAEQNNDKMVKLLLDLKADINSPPAKINGRTALQAAAEKANIRTLKFLLKRKDLDPNVLGAQVSGVTALLAGAGSGGEWQMGKNIHRTIKQRSRLPGSAEIDTKKIAEEDQQDRDHRQKEEQAHEEVVNLLVNCDQGIQLIPNQFGWTALHAAAERESDAMVDDILTLDGADFNHRADHDGTPLHSAKAKANEELARKLEEEGKGTDECVYSKLDLDAMMKYVRAVLTRLMIKSNTERFFFIQSYIPIYHLIYSYCAEGADDQNDNPPVEKGGRRGELVYRDVDAWLKSYVMWNQKFINDTPAEQDFLTVYLREWKIFKRGAYYVGRMLRYLTRHWAKHQREELGHLDVRDIADLFFHRWRSGMTHQVRTRIKTEMVTIDKNIMKATIVDTRVLDAVNESLGGPFRDFKNIFQEAEEYFLGFKKLPWEGDRHFEVRLRELTDEFVVQSEVWVAKKPEAKHEEIIRREKMKVLRGLKVQELNQSLFTDDSAAFYLNNVEPHFLALYSGGRINEIKRDLDTLWDMLRDDKEEAKKRAENRARQANVDGDNADSDVNGGIDDGENTHTPNVIEQQQTSLKEATEAMA